MMTSGMHRRPFEGRHLVNKLDYAVPRLFFYEMKLLES